MGVSYFSLNYLRSKLLLGTKWIEALLLNISFKDQFHLEFWLLKRSFRIVLSQAGAWDRDEMRKIDPQNFKHFAVW
jgi:hypothetical protein